MMEIPPVLTLTADTAAYYAEACDGLSEETADSELYPGLSRGDACDWAVIGFTVQGWLTFKEQLLMQRAYIELLNTNLAFYKRQLKERHNSVQK